MNNKGQIIIIDVLLYLIISIIILSTIIYAIETINDNQVTIINNRQLNTLLDDNLSILAKTSGKPDNWENVNNNEIETIGLKSADTHTLSYDKIIKLKNNPHLLENNFPPGVDYSLTLYPKNNPNDEEIIVQKGIFNNKKQIQTRNRQVIIDYNLKVVPLDDSNDSCCYQHNSNWSCKTININENTLANTKYYLVSDSNIEYILSNTYSENFTGQAKKTCINSQLEQLMINDNQTISIHTKSNTKNTFLVYDTGDREKFLESVIKPEVYVLKLKIAV